MIKKLPENTPAVFFRRPGKQVSAILLFLSVLQMLKKHNQ